jgi:putative nucleotidyltransferase with HDIG domain
MGTMDATKPISIEKQIESLPPMPTTVTRVMEITNDPESSANDLLKAILPDQTMCVAILKVANSVLYGRPKQVSSLETAITVLGFDEVRNIVLARAALTAFRPIAKTHRREMNAFWDHAFNCALAARIIGEHINHHTSGQLFVAGLLHDIGKLAMLLAFGEKYNGAKWLTGFSTAIKLEAERQTFSVTHDKVGAKLLQRWQFPDNLVAALGYHHLPGNSPSLPVYPLIIQLADFLSFMNIQPETPNQHALKKSLQFYLPNFENQWRQQNLPWEEISLESWFVWLKVDQRHGSGILDILAA